MLTSIYLLLSLMSSAHANPGAGNLRPILAAITCKAVSRTQLETVLGRSVEDQFRQDSGRESTCSYSAGTAAVTISITQLTGDFDLSAELQNLSSAFPGSTLRRMPDVAGNAFALEIEGAGTQLHLVEGEREYVMISVLGLGRGHNGLDAALEIARRLTRR